MATADDGVSTAQAEPGSQRTQVRRAAMASTIGTTIEWYDFFLYNTAAALVFPHLFFPASSAYAGAMQSFATYFVGFAARPIGAAIFGHWGDRIGRKTTLIITLLAVGLVIRLKILETPMFSKVLEHGKTASAPVAEAIRRHWREILLSAGARFAEQMPFYLFTTFVLIYVVERHHYSKTFVLTAVLVGAAVELATIPYFSHLSDSLGRKRVYLAGAIIAGLFAFPYFAVLTYGGPVPIFIAVVLSMIVHSMMYGPQAALIGESFPTHLRYG